MGRHGWNSGARRGRLTALLGVGVAALALVRDPPHTLPGSGAGTDGHLARRRQGARHAHRPRPTRTRPGRGLGLHPHPVQRRPGRAAADRAGRGAAVRRRRAAAEPAHHGLGRGQPRTGPRGATTSRDLDRRIDLIRASGGTPVITLCCAPDWMKGGEAGVDNTDWSQAALETAPEPAHYADFAAARRDRRQALSGRPALHRLERVQGILERRRGPLGLRGLHPSSTTWSTGR